VPRDYHAHDGEISTIGVGYDGGDESEAALISACELARRIGSRVRVIRVFDATRVGTPAVVPWIDYASIHKELEASQREQLVRRVEALNADAEAEAVFVAGSPGPTLAAEAAAADVLVMDSRGCAPCCSAASRTRSCARRPVR
jgi:nucleotide-binding universal stress UspA family protein